MLYVLSQKKKNKYNAESGDSYRMLYIYESIQF